MGIVLNMQKFIYIYRVLLPFINIEYLQILKYQLYIYYKHRMIKGTLRGGFLSIK